MPKPGVRWLRLLQMAAFSAVVASFFTAAAPGAEVPAPPPAVKVGEVAPDFKLQYFDGSGLKDVTLSQYRGKKNVVVAFYVFAFTGG